MIKMIAVARKNLLSLISSPNPLIHNPILHFSTSRIKIVNPSTAIYDLLAHKHHLSPKTASIASLHLNQVRSPKRADSILSFLIENSFTTVQIERVIKYKPRILTYNLEDLKLKHKAFRELGLPPDEIAKIMSSGTTIFHSSVERILLSLSLLYSVLGSDREVARLLRRSTWFITANLEDLLMPNLEILKGFGVSMERIIRFLYLCPRSFLVKPNVMRKSIDRTVELGVPCSSKVFLHAATVFACTSEGMWEVKLQTLRDLGFSDDDALAMFRKLPFVFLNSAKKMKKVIELLLDTGKYSVSSIVNNPSSIGCSIEKRFQPRLQILSVLESRNLIEEWPGLGRLFSFTDDRFFDTFVKPYYDEIEKEYTKIYEKGKTKSSVEARETGMCSTNA